MCIEDTAGRFDARSAPAMQNVNDLCSAIIRCSHLTLHPSMFLGIPGLKKGLHCLFFAAVLLGELACNNYNNSNPYNNTTITTGSSFPLTAYVSNPVQPNGFGGGSPALDILDASKDLLSVSTIALASLSASVAGAGMMVESPQHDRTLVLSPTDHKLAIVSNTQQFVSSAVTLAGSTESFFVWSDNVTAFVAEPNAATPGLSPGAVERVSLATARVTATIPVPGAHYIVPSPNGKTLLVFSDNSDSITMITPSLIGVNGQSDTVAPCSSMQAAACSLNGAFDRPVWAVFSGSGNAAYILNCGEQCGGTGAGACLTFTSCTTVAALDMTQTPPVITGSAGVPAATIATLQGSSLFVVGTPSSAADNACTGITTAAASCGRLTVVDVGAMTAATPLVITDGYHNRIQITPTGQLFIGSRGCSNVNVAGGEQRGCLTIVNSTAANVAQTNVIAPPDNGDVTGIEPIPGRSVVYLCEGGQLRIYDTTTDKLQQFPPPKTQPGIPGTAVDVKVVKF